jgi:hypothetical protein
MDDPNLIAAISLVLGFVFSVAGMLRIMERSHRPRGAMLGAVCVLLGLCLTIFGSLLFVRPDSLNGAAPQTADSFSAGSYALGAPTGTIALHPVGSANCLGSGHAVLFSECRACRRGGSDAR